MFDDVAITFARSTVRMPRSNFEYMPTTLDVQRVGLLGLLKESFIEMHVPNGRNRSI
jgi:hypothetical protein